MIRKDGPIEINAHGEGWYDVGYVRADIAKKRVDDCEAEKSALREYAKASAEEITRLKRLTQTLWEACAKAAELIQHDEDGTGKWMAVDVLEKAVDDCIEHDQQQQTTVDTLTPEKSMFDLLME